MSVRDQQSVSAKVPLVPLKSAMPWIAACLFLLLLPQIFPSGAGLTIMNQMAITIIFALAYNMLLGQAGMLSFGHAVYMGLGGFFWLMLHTQKPSVAN